MSDSASSAAQSAIPAAGAGHERAVLEARDVHAFYGKSHILHGVSLRLDEGEIVTVLDRNGAGKTTTMRSLMLLDEPSQGLAPLVVQEVMQVVRRMRDEGLSVLLVEQNVPLALGAADRAYVLDDGKVVYSGSAAELAANRDLVDKLAGATAESTESATDALLRASR